MSLRFRLMLQALLPPGKAYPRGEDGRITETLDGCAIEFERIQDRADELRLELDPRTTTELIEDWEERFGFPDECAPINDTLQERRDAIVARMAIKGEDVGGQRVDVLTALATALGFTVFAIRRFHLEPFTCESACDADLHSDSHGWYMLWEFQAVHLTVERDNFLRCQLEREAPFGNGKTYSFPLMDYDDVTFTRTGTAVLEHPVTGKETTLGTGVPGVIYVGV